MSPFAFLPTFSTKRIGQHLRNVSNSNSSRSPLCPRTNPMRMMQRPDQEGPPELGQFFDQTYKSAATIGEPVTLGTGRALLEHNDNDLRRTCLAAFTAAQGSLPTPPQLVHCTFSLDFDPHAVAETLRQQVQVPIIGRSVSKKNSAGTIEVLVLSSADENGISFASATVDVTEDRELASSTSAVTAANRALDGLSSRDSCTFMMFCHTPGDDHAVRAGLDQAFPGVIAYGGPAVGDTSGNRWALLGGPSVESGPVHISKTVHVAAVPGSLSFLYSAVIKNWVQPAFTEALSYMKPSYIGDPQTDLLVAIRYNDWEKFLWCIENQGVDVNTKWQSKQNQSPLLAACARARTEIIKYLLNNGADVAHRNDGGFTASMYTRMLSEYDRPLVLNQLKMLEDAGADTQLTQQEREMLIRAASGRIVE